jgi:hypothetical protein
MVGLATEIYGNSHWSKKNQKKSENIRKKSEKNRKLNRNKSKQIPKVQYFLFFV